MHSIAHIAIVLSLAASAFGQTTAPTRYPDVPYVPSPHGVVDGMLKLAGVKAGDTVYDLGCGDGRIVISSVKNFSATKAVGVDIDPERIKEATANAKQAGVADKATFVQGDLFTAPISEATVVTLYLLPGVNQKLKPRLLSELRPGTRVVSHSFDMGDWEPKKTIEVEGKRLHLWIVPEKSAAASK